VNTSKLSMSKTNDDGDTESEVSNSTESVLNSLELNEKLLKFNSSTSAVAENTSTSSRHTTPTSRPLSPEGPALTSSRPNTGNRTFYRPDTAYSTPPTSVLRTHNGLREGQLLYQIGSCNVWRETLKCVLHLQTNADIAELLSNMLLHTILKHKTVHLPLNSNVYRQIRSPGSNICTVLGQGSASETCSDRSEAVPFSEGTLLLQVPSSDIPKLLDMLTDHKADIKGLQVTVHKVVVHSDRSRDRSKVPNNETLCVYVYRLFIKILCICRSSTAAMNVLS
jgi:hypothetical protein